MIPQSRRQPSDRRTATTVLARRQWNDLYPDTLTISVLVDQAHEAHVVMTGHAVFLTPVQLAEVQDWLAHCKAIIDDWHIQGEKIDAWTA